MNDHAYSALPKAGSRTCRSAKSLLLARFGVLRTSRLGKTHLPSRINDAPPLHPFRYRLFTAPGGHVWAGSFQVLVQVGVQALCSSRPSQPAAATQVNGRAVNVDDGDTVALLLPGNVKLKVRLASMDAPEVSHTKHEFGRAGQ